MNDQQRAAMQMALEALHNTSNALLFVSADGYSVSKMAADAYDDAEKAITALREALAQEDAPQTCERHCERNAYQIEIRRLKRCLFEMQNAAIALAQPQDHSEQHLNMVQGDWVQTQLKKGKILTQIDAFNGCGTIRLAVHIEILRHRGLNIVTHRRIAKNGSRYAAYQLIKGKK